VLLSAGSRKRCNFAGFEGKRTAFMPDLSDMIPFAEPFFQGMNTDVVIIPIMNGDEMQKGLGNLG
jgi:hypothetical protein